MAPCYGSEADRIALSKFRPCKLALCSLRRGAVQFEGPCEPEAKQDLLSLRWRRRAARTARIFRRRQTYARPPSVSTAQSQRLGCPASLLPLRGPSGHHRKVGLLDAAEAERHRVSRRLSPTGGSGGNAVELAGWLAGHPPALPGGSRRSTVVNRPCAVGSLGAPRAQPTSQSGGAMAEICEIRQTPSVADDQRARTPTRLAADPDSACLRSFARASLPQGASSAAAAAACHQSAAPCSSTQLRPWRLTYRALWTLRLPSQPTPLFPLRSSVRS
ncbi:hypothetical protein L1887_59091 [Cichorium endivia]|nr:hypothetical protein L1887_59091 [Cichorium endivia]